MSFIEKAMRSIDDRIFSANGLSDTWNTNGFEVEAILNEQEIDDNGFFIKELTLDVVAAEVNKFTKGAIISRVADNATYKIIRIGRPIDNVCEILLGDESA